MDRIHYAGDSLLTGTEIARALLEYAKALAKTEQSATVDIPVRHDDGTVGRANFLVGPASQLVSESEASPFGELDDPALVDVLTKETLKLKPAHPMSSDGAPDAELNRMDDL
ncbi:hypothetical protein N1027_11335 [Herbiconiux sp. CPCC 205763]|uniref:Uncharacterized protein n=1 Tax=Herbiconiux aconitum TaxID=2970913 RepID=A0ABT2GTT8_9MICO|nr:hypothetical protein [Herbiconiux aconitum]MCS5718725.1 hypothetical protein [Herbiconiux aconitum]